MIKMPNMNNKRMALLTSLILLNACSHIQHESSQVNLANAPAIQNQSRESEFTYIDIKQIESNKQKVKGSTDYQKALNKVLIRADKALKRADNPVTNKPKPAPSGDLHDYLSIGPYWWPDPSKPDGLPWIRKDGEVNPQTGVITQIKPVPALF